MLTIYVNHTIYAYVRIMLTQIIVKLLFVFLKFYDIIIKKFKR